MKSMIRIISLMTGLVCAGLAFAEEFVIGVAPHTSARVILQTYQPLRLHLEKSLSMPVEIRTAPDFDEFARRALAQEYDIAVTTGHQARLLQTDAKYLPLVTYKAGFKAVALVAANNPIRKPQELKGTNVLGLSPTSLVTLWGQHWLAENNMGSLPVKFVSASDSVAQLVASGEASCGFTSLANYQVLPAQLQAQVRIFAESPPMAGRVYMLNSRQGVRKKLIDKALSDFGNTIEGKTYFETKKLEGYRKLKPKELESMDRYAAEVRKALNKGDK